MKLLDHQLDNMFLIKTSNLFMNLLYFRWQFTIEYYTASFDRNLYSVKFLYIASVPFLYYFFRNEDSLSRLREQKKLKKSRYLQVDINSKTSMAALQSISSWLFLIGLSSSLADLAIYYVCAQTSTNFSAQWSPV